MTSNFDRFLLLSPQEIALAEHACASSGAASQRHFLDDNRNRATLLPLAVKFGIVDAANLPTDIMCRRIHAFIAERDDYYDRMQDDVMQLPNDILKEYIVPALLRSVNPGDIKNISRLVTGLFRQIQPSLEDVFECQGGKDCILRKKHNIISISIFYPIITTTSVGSVFAGFWLDWDRYRLRELKEYQELFMLHSAKDTTARKFEETTLRNNPPTPGVNHKVKIRSVLEPYGEDRSGRQIIIFLRNVLNNPIVPEDKVVLTMLLRRNDAIPDDPSYLNFLQGKLPPFENPHENAGRNWYFNDVRRNRRIPVARVQWTAGQLRHWFKRPQPQSEGVHILKRTNL